MWRGAVALVVEGDAEPVAARSSGGDVVVAAAQVLHEGASPPPRPSAEPVRVQRRASAIGVIMVAGQKAALEPANGLDAAGVHWLRTFLREFAAVDKTVLVSSHLLAELAQMVDSVLIVTGGRLLAHRRLNQLDGGADALESYYLELTAKEERS